MASKRILMGLHKSSTLKICYDRARASGYEVDGVMGLDDMRRKIGEADYDAYLMDANLGSPGCLDVRPAIEIYGLVRDRVESGETKFLSVSFGRGTVTAAREAGIPSEHGGEGIDKFFGLLEE